MQKIGLFYGSDTGVTEEITHIILEHWDGEEIDIHEICDVTVKNFEDYSILFLGLSTWYDGDLQSDWEDFFNDFKTIDFKGKIVAVFGLGDQYGYPEYFIDGVGILAKVIIENGGTIIGHWPTDEYDYTESVADMEDGYFYGLALDNDNQSELTDIRIEEWLIKVKEALKQTTNNKSIV